MVALGWSPWRAFNAYARISTSFEPPSTTELANPDDSGGFNPDIEAHKNDWWQRELVWQSASWQRNR